MKLSIIIPAFNVENLIVRCLKSVLNQDLTSNEYEIIIVDDGSTDNTYNVIKYFIADKSNISLIKQNNKRQGAARNNALNYAKGEYIWFVDSDDYIEENVLLNLYNTAKKDNLDLLCFSNYRFTLDHEISKARVSKKISFNKVYLGKDIINLKSIYCGPCFCIIKNKFLKDNKLKFIEGVFYEDNEFMMKAYYFAKKVLYIDSYNYYVFLSSGSATRSVNSQSIFDIIKVVKEMLVFTNNIYNNKKTRMNCWYYTVMLFNTALSKIKNQDKNTHKQFINKLKPIKKDLVKAMFKSTYSKYILEGIICFLSIKLLLRLSKNL